MRQTPSPKGMRHQHRLHMNKRGGTGFDMLIDFMGILKWTFFIIVVFVFIGPQGCIFRPATQRIDSATSDGPQLSLVLLDLLRSPANLGVGTTAATPSAAASIGTTAGSSSTATTSTGSGATGSSTTDPSLAEILQKVNKGDAAMTDWLRVNLPTLLPDPWRSHYGLRIDFPSGSIGYTLATPISQAYVAADDGDVIRVSVVALLTQEDALELGFNDLGEARLAEYNTAEGLETFSVPTGGSGSFNAEGMPTDWGYTPSGTCADVVEYAFGYLGTSYASTGACSASRARAGQCSTQCGSFVSNVFRYSRGPASIPWGNGNEKCNSDQVTRVWRAPDSLQPGDIFSIRSGKYGHTGIYVGRGYWGVDAKGNYVYSQDPNGKYVFIHSTTGCNPITKRCREVQFTYWENIERRKPIFCRNKVC